MTIRFTNLEHINCGYNLIPYIPIKAGWRCDFRNAKKVESNWCYANLDQRFPFAI